MKILSLSGGGTQGAYQAGVMIQDDVWHDDFDCVYGTSVGSLNAVLFKYATRDEVKELWNNVKRSDIFDFNFGIFLLRGGIWKLDPLMRLLKKYLSRKPLNDCTLFATYTDYETGMLNYVPDTSPDFPDAVMKSSVMPVMMSPWLGDLDGGVRDFLPINRSMMYKPNLHVTGISTMPMLPVYRARSKWPSPLSDLSRMIELMTYQRFLGDIRDIKAHAKSLRMYSFDDPFDPLSFDLKTIRKAFEKGTKSMPVWHDGHMVD